MTTDVETPAPPDTTRRGRGTVAVVALSAFGPYVTSGLRTEQVAVYATALVLAVGAWWIKARPNGHGAAVLALLVLQLAIAVVGAVDPPLNTTRYQAGDALAGVDNFAAPIAVAATAWILLAAGGDRERLIRCVCWVTVWAMVANAGLAAWATGGSGPNLTAFQGPAEVESVAFRAEQLGRFSGIFNQPAEAGMLYSVALLAAIYLYRERARMLAVTATALSVGGVLTVSKVFLFVGLPLGIWQALRSAGGRQRRFAAFLAAAVAAWAGAKTGLVPEWIGARYLIRLMPGSNQGATELYTAGRFGEQSTLSGVIDAVQASSPVWGFGAAGLRVPYDNAWVEALAVGGIAGAVLLTTVIAVLVHAWWISRDWVPPAESRLSGGLVAVVIGAAVGIPSLTANRCSTILWLLLALLLLTRRQRVNQVSPSV